MKATVKTPPVNNNSPFSGMKGNHVALRVPDFEASKKWFTEKLDFRVIHEWPFGELSLAYLAPAADDHFWIELLAGGNPADRPAYGGLNESLHRAGYHHFCINVDDMDATLAELRKRDVNIISEAFELEVIGRRLAFIADPWGNLIELAQIL